MSMDGVMHERAMVANAGEMNALGRPVFGKQVHAVVGVLPKTGNDTVFVLDDGTYARITDLQLLACGVGP